MLRTTLSAFVLLRSSGRMHIGQTIFTAEAQSNPSLIKKLSELRVLCVSAVESYLFLVAALPRCVSAVRFI
jgi:hypothetical protein